MVAIGHAFSLAGNFAGLKLLTRWLRPESYGELALAMTAAGAIFSLGYSPLAGAMLRYHSVHEEQGALPMHVALFRRAHGQLLSLIHI